MAEAGTEQSNVLTEVLVYLKPVQELLGGSSILLAMVILVLAFVMANIVAMIVTRIIARLAKRTLFTWDDQVIDIFHRPLFWSVLLFGLLVAMIPLGLPSIVINVFQSLIITLLVIVWSTFLIRLIRIALRALSTSQHRHAFVQPQTRPLFENVGVILVVAVAIYFIFGSSPNRVGRLT